LIQIAKSLVKDTKSLITKKDTFLNVDHIFKLKGKGFVLTGTMLSGNLEKNTILKPLRNPDLTFKVKSIQSFKQNLESASQGDRVGVMVQGDKTDLLKESEREIFVNLNTKVIKVKHFLAVVSRVPYFKMELKSGSFCYSLHIGGYTQTCKLEIYNAQNIGNLEKTARERFSKEKCKILD